MEFKQYRRKQIAEIRPYEEGENLTKVSVGAEDRKKGSPRLGDMIARNPNDHEDQWLISEEYFTTNFDPL
jgi:hypothetical protein